MAAGDTGHQYEFLVSRPLKVILPAIPVERDRPLGMRINTYRMIYVKNGI